MIPCLTTISRVTIINVDQQTSWCLACHTPRQSHGPRMTLGSDDIGYITQTSACVDAVQMTAASLDLCRRNPSASWACPPSNLGRKWSHQARIGLVTHGSSAF